MDPFSFAIAAVAQIGIGMLFPSEGPRMKDLKVSASTYGATIPQVFGTARLAANMIWSDKIKEIKKKKRVGLKTFKYYVYTCTFAMGVCVGPVTNIRRIWANYKLVYDATGASEFAIKNKSFRVKTYLGSEDQLPNAAMEKKVGVGKTPAYRGLCYIVFEDMRLEDFGNTIPQISVEVFATGESESIATSTPFIELEPELDMFAGEFAVDPILGYMYVPAGGDGYTRRFRISDGQEDLINFDTDTYTVMGASPITGNIICQQGLANSVEFAMLEPFGMAEIARIGELSSSFAFEPNGGPGVFSTNDAGDEWYMYSSLFTTWAIMKTLPEGTFTDENFYVFDGDGGRAESVSQNGVYGQTFIAGTRDGEEPCFYCWDGNNAVSPTLELNLWKVSPSGTHWTTELLYTIPWNTVNHHAVQGCHWDRTDGNLLLIWTHGGRTQMGKFDLTLEDFRWTKDVEGKGNPGDVLPAVIENGEFMWASGSRLYIIDTMTGEWVTQLRDPYDDYDNPFDVPKSVIEAQEVPYTGIPITPSFGSGGQFFDPMRNMLIGSRRMVKPGLSPVSTTTLGDFVERLLRKGGLSTTYFDMSGLNSVDVAGYAWASGTDIKSILDQLRMIYMFDILERDGKLVGVLRSQGANELHPGRAARKIQQKVLGNSGNDTEGMDFWQETRLQDADLPHKISFSYMNLEDDMVTSTAVMKRVSTPVPTMFSHQQVAMEIGLVMTPSQAKNQVAKMLWSQWGERQKHATRLPWAYMDLDPADIVTVTMNDGRRYIERIHQNEIGADFGIGVETYSQDSGAYVAGVTADGGGAGGSDGITAPRPAKAFIINTPLLRDQDDTGGNYSLYYTAVGNGRPEQFEGAGLYRSLDNLTYDLLYGTDQDVEWGQVSGRLKSPRHGAFALDWENKITIWPVISWFELESITDDELWAGGNLCVVGNEVIQFRDCVQNVNGSWTIWNLLRGRRGTEYACDTHKIGEPFIALAPETIVGEGETLDQRGQRRYFRAVGEGWTLADAPPVTVIYEPRDLMPYAPADIRRTIVGSTITLDWKRRTRMGGNMVDFVDTVPLNETSEKYEVYILSAPFTGDLSRGGELPLDDIIYSTTTDTSTHSFDVSAMTAPIDVNLDTLHVLIYQVSASVGRGFPGVRSIEHWQDF